MDPLSPENKLNWEEIFKKDPRIIDAIKSEEEIDVLVEEMADLDMKDRRFILVDRFVNYNDRIKEFIYLHRKHLILQLKVSPDDKIEDKLITLKWKTNIKKDKFFYIQDNESKRVFGLDLKNEKEGSEWSEANSELVKKSDFGLVHGVFDWDIKSTPKTKYIQDTIIIILSDTQQNIKKIYKIT